MKINKKKLTKKAQKTVKQDAIVSIAIVSVLINLFFFSWVLIFSSTNQIDMETYDAAKENLCVNNYTDNLLDFIGESDDPALTKALFEIKCVNGEFQRYYDNAVEAYLSDTL